MLILLHASSCGKLVLLLVLAGTFALTYKEDNQAMTARLDTM